MDRNDCIPLYLPRKNGQDTSPLLHLHRPQEAPALAPRHRWRRPWAITGRGPQVMAILGKQNDGEKNLENHGKMMIEPRNKKKIRHPKSGPFHQRSPNNHLAWALDAHISPLSPIFCDSGETCTTELPESPAGTCYGMMMERSSTQFGQ